MELNDIVVITSRPERLEKFRQDWPDLEAEPVTAVPDRNFEKSCLETHMRAWDTHQGPLLVFEDDAVPRDFTLDFTPPSDWEILWLGGQHIESSVSYGETWVRPRKLLRTHAYILRRPAFIAAEMRRIAATRLDPTMSLLHVPQYALRTWTVCQGPAFSDHHLTTRTTTECWD